MKIRFNIDYRTYWGQKVMLTGSAKELGNYDISKAVELKFKGGETWEAEVNFDSKSIGLNYKYVVRNENTGDYEMEYGDYRSLTWSKGEKVNLQVSDCWRSGDHQQNTLYTSPFKNGLLNFNVPQDLKFEKKKNFQIRLRVLSVPADCEIGIVGESEKLGNWQPEAVIPLQKSSADQWFVNLQLDPDDLPTSYKYVLYNPAKGEVVDWESGRNRNLDAYQLPEKGAVAVISDEYACFPLHNWRGAGVAIPVFSIRTKEGTGVGEFTDIKVLVDWALKTGMKLIQILPVNDTVANNTWVDSYPYAAISVFALHPLYLNLWEMGKLKNAKRNQYYLEKREQLNELEEVDYESVMDLKWEYTTELYQQNGTKTLASKGFEEFLKANEAWLPAYAMFAYLRDKYKTPDFSTWKTHKTVTEKQIATFTKKGGKNYEAIGYYYFLQYHLDKQLKEASRYARDKGVVLKGDIPIGIYRNSVDAWVSPNLYNMESQAGAPPDDFSITGQNWGFPTYNWDEMAKDDYAWWKMRLQKMTDYFDVFRIDHILGFFRIWEIPIDAVEGLLGHFNPSLPFGLDELKHKGIAFDYDRLCKPYIRDYMLNEIFGDQTDQVIHTFFDHQYYDVYQFKNDFNTQRKLKNYFDELIEKDANSADHNNFLRFQLYRIVAEVIFLEAPFSDGQAFNPRIALHSTYSYKALDDYTRSQIDKLYIEYYYQRHNDFWAEKAMQKLPALKEATNMLICGEDLGMVPDCVPGVMDKLKILSLAIQRMPNDSSKEFWHPADTGYLSVCSTSSHDMSTLRGWWEEDEATTQRFYETILGHGEKAPFYCEPYVAREIINQHLYSPSMWAIFPIQDLIAIDGQMRRTIPEEERINVPANPQHYWRYRFHMNIEDLLDQEGLNNNIQQMVTSAGRNVVY
ncbi:MAG: 4-alpha-glucanotransferase [Bacteroidota bacterium]